jgi:hypothetical protein
MATINETVQVNFFQKHFFLHQLTHNILQYRQYDKRLFIELRVQHMKITSSEHVVYINCSECQNKNKEQIITHNSMNNLLSCCGLVDARIRAFDKDLPVTNIGI